MIGDDGTQMLGAKKMNYQFLLMVRDKNYPEALALGKKILEIEPDNPSIKKFCDFILANNKELGQMVKQQKEEQQYEEVDSDDDGEQSQSEGNESKSSSSEEKSQDEKQQEEEEEQEEEEPQKKEHKKIQLTTCTLNQIPHICTRNHN